MNKKYTYILALVISLSLGCKDRRSELLFFKNMNQPSEFNLIKDKSVLSGFDKIMLKPSKKVKDLQYYELCSPKKGSFNISGLIWLKDSIVYIRPSQTDDFKDQILFDFRNRKTSWCVNYKIGEVQYYLNMHSIANRYDNKLMDRITAFKISKGLRIASWTDDYYLVASLKFGFVQMTYLDDSLQYDIEFFPIQKVSKIKRKPDIYRDK